MKESREVETIVAIADGDVTAQVAMGAGASARIRFPQPNGSGILETQTVYIVSSSAASEMSRVFHRVTELLAEHENALALRHAYDPQSKPAEKAPEPPGA